jgi:hypothetical protein
MAGAMVIACQPTGPSTPSPGASASGQASPSPVLSPTPTPGPPNVVWADQPFPEIVTAVTVDQGQFVAVGRDVSRPGGVDFVGRGRLVQALGNSANLATTWTRSNLWTSGAKPIDDGSDGPHR